MLRLPKQAAFCATGVEVSMDEARRIGIPADDVAASLSDVYFVVFLCFIAQNFKWVVVAQKCVKPNFIAYLNM